MSNALTSDSSDISMDDGKLLWLTQHETFLTEESV
jgi:hypothetical protein